jgi:hypothetical protein
MNALVEESDWIWMAASSRAAHSVRVNSGENCDMPFLRFRFFAFSFLALHSLYSVKHTVVNLEMSMHKRAGGDHDRGGNRVLALRWLMS